MSLVVGFFCLLISISKSTKLTESKIFDCGKLTGDKTAVNQTNCADVPYCYWDAAANSGAGGCVKDTCLETKGKVNAIPVGSGNPCTDAANGCTNAKFTSTANDATAPCAPNEWIVYCANIENDAEFDQCAYNFIDSDGICSNNNCKTYKYGTTVWDAAAAVAGEDICTSSYLNQLCSETYGAQNCYLNPNCMIDNGQCVADRCTNYLSGCDEGKATNGQKKCKEYYKYFPTISTDATKFESDALPTCYYSGEKYPGSEYPYANPCFALPTVIPYGDKENNPSGVEHRCEKNECTDTDDEWTKNCPLKDISKFCTSADVLGGISCKVASSSIIGEFCSDGRNDYVAPVEETACGAASVLRSPFSFVVLILVAFLMMLFN